MIPLQHVLEKLCGNVNFGDALCITLHLPESQCVVALLTGELVRILSLLGLELLVLCLLPADCCEV